MWYWNELMVLLLIKWDNNDVSILKQHSSLSKVLFWWDTFHWGIRFFSFQYKYKILNVILKIVFRVSRINAILRESTLKLLSNCEKKKKTNRFCKLSVAHVYILPFFNHVYPFIQLERSKISMQCCIFNSHFHNQTKLVMFSIFLYLSSGFSYHTSCVYM